MSDQSDLRVIEQAIVDYKKKTKRAIPADVANAITTSYLLQLYDAHGRPAYTKNRGYLGGQWEMQDWEDLRYCGLENHTRTKELLKSWGAQLRKERGRESVKSRISQLKNVKVTRQTYERIESGTTVKGDVWVSVLCELGYSASVEELFGVDTHHINRRAGMQGAIREVISEQWQQLASKKKRGLAIEMEQEQQAQRCGVSMATFRKFLSKNGVLMIDTMIVARANFRKTKLERNAFGDFAVLDCKDPFPSLQLEHALEFVEAKIKNCRS
jgi:DNA-binding XRE family transcriptional regulator